MMPEWLAYANLGLNLLLVPLLGLLWKMSTSIVKLEVQVGYCAKETENLRAEIITLRAQMDTNASVGVAASTAASSAVEAAAAATKAALAATFALGQKEGRG